MSHERLIEIGHHLFRKQLSEQGLTALLDALCKDGMVKIDGMKVAYDLPSKVVTDVSVRKNTHEASDV